MTTPMFASIRKYNGSSQLSDELFKLQDDLKSVIRPIRGFHAYYLVKTTDGAVSFTVCEDKAGAEESNRAEAAWLKTKLPTFASRSPETTIGEVNVRLRAELAKATV